MNDYERVARVIRFLNESHTEQPGLAELAEHVGLSPFHFHRLFSSWAAISPKDFLQCLTVAHTKQLLRAGERVLETAFQAGLSGPGRLHDLCVSLEAATPGEMKSGGEGWTISAGFADSPFGRFLMGESPRGICHLSFIDAQSDQAALDDLQAAWPEARIKHDDPAASRLSSAMFPQSRDLGQQRPLRMFVRGTAFQVRVWRALLQISPGTLVSYGRLASVIGGPAAARAVGSAVGKNSLAYLIPCHRVIRQTGVVGEYRWGSVRKRAMVAWENSPRSLRK